ncbi:hypothetical protein [Streptomyces sp. NPDC004546]|uniref:hypothetical protein n=1 Tax=Streptomyces sp. NPDC004546 TaxID=3154282 RepID=UPI0033B16747
MSRISHSVIVAPVPRAWFEQAVVVLLDVVRGTRAEEGQVLLPDGRAIPGVRLVKGDHLAPGAVYEAEAEDGRHQEAERLRIVERRSGNDPAVRLEHVLGDEDTVTVVEGALHTVSRPVSVELRGSVRVLGRWASLRRASGDARVDLRAWWEAAAGRRYSGTPFEAHLEHRLGVATLWAVPRPYGDGRWEVRLVLSLGGRSLLRPVAALALLLFRGRLREAFTDTADRTAEVWNEIVPETVSQDRIRLRARILDAAASPPEETRL